MSSASPTTTTTDAQTWVWPPAGAATPPIAATANFGPVHQGDTMILQWTPADKTPDVLFVCFSDINKNVSSAFAARSATSPAQFKPGRVTDTIPGESTFCHLYFSPLMGNSVVFQYSNTPVESAITWALSSSPTTSTSSTSSTTSSTSTSTSTSTSSSPVTSSSAGPSTVSPMGTSSSNQSSATALGDSTNNSPGLSTGASAGIGVGVALGILALLALGVLMFLRRRKRKAAVGGGYNGSGPGRMSEMDAASSKPLSSNMPYRDAGYHEKEVPPPELPGSDSGHGRAELA